LQGALRNLAPLFKGEELKEFLLYELDESRNIDYPEFVNSLSIELIKKFPERINYYVMSCVEHYQSRWDTIKANGATFTGFLLGNLPIEKRRNLNPTIVARALISLLKERSPKVRRASAEAMSFMHSY